MISRTRWFTKQGIRDLNGIETTCIIHIANIGIISHLFDKKNEKIISHY